MTICAACGVDDDSHDRADARLLKKTHFRSGQIRVLRDVFHRVAKSDDKIDFKEFQLALYGDAGDEKSSDLFSERIFACFDARGDGTVSFEEFVVGLDVFHPDASVEDKTAFAFRVYDLRGVGAINREDVRKMLEAVLRQSRAMSLTKEMTESVLDKTFEDCDLNKNGTISLSEFQILVKKNDRIIANMTMENLASLTKRYPEFLFADYS
ncbi:EF-Hand 1, calcium-binding site [Ostreococcus tauri]|jgi:serine/threonine-protein phosphatase 2B regulatory subunit|uniref:Calcineurin B-like protein 01 n=1 Tax=Ostreococcus tauri TaxID=70448 RepID=Q00UG0_OSTTA|nr:EF-Hand 1, calcium-binding site [Ostreococcus tauri]ACQ83538.1 calcineurin B-like protein 01 [Ostreococcus tauri]OUS44249.1 calcineurin B-like protein 01 [Ostreococcus tauri]CAL58089.1 EF-Hand 1, calcium-binding site [Ostreococcus tauri]|eukprot:XP_003083540.1 EF-Hand 1, calcium-binding site [Ostreococcus tauri]